VGRRAAADAGVRSPKATGGARLARGTPHTAARGADLRTPLETPAMRLSEVARRLAVSRAAAYRLVRSGQLRGIQVGQTWRVLREDFDAYLAERRTEAERRYRRIRDG
jgi:excisionase family DNA binding protein